MPLERPFVLRLDHFRGAFESIVDIAGFLVDAALAHARLADVIVERSLLGEGRLNLGPFDLELLRSLDRIPFLVGDDAQEALVPYDPRARNVLDRALIDVHRAGRIMRPCTMPGTVMSVTKSS